MTSWYRRDVGQISGCDTFKLQISVTRWLWVNIDKLTMLIHPMGLFYLQDHKTSIAIVPFHKSQCALRYLDPMSKIQNTSSQRSLATWLTVTANEQNDDWPAPVSVVSVQPVIGWLKDGAARHWSHIVHRPRPHGNLPLPWLQLETVFDIASNILHKITLRATKPPH